MYVKLRVCAHIFRHAFRLGMASSFIFVSSPRLSLKFFSHLRTVLLGVKTPRSSLFEWALYFNEWIVPQLAIVGSTQLCGLCQEHVLSRKLCATELYLCIVGIPWNRRPVSGQTFSHLLICLLNMLSISSLCLLRGKRQSPGRPSYDQRIQEVKGITWVIFLLRRCLLPWTLSRKFSSRLKTVLLSHFGVGNTSEYSLFEWALYSNEWIVPQITIVGSTPLCGLCDILSRTLCAIELIIPLYCWYSVNPPSR